MQRQTHVFGLAGNELLRRGEYVTSVPTKTRDRRLNLFFLGINCVRSFFFSCTVRDKICHKNLLTLFCPPQIVARVNVINNTGRIIVLKISEKRNNEV